MNKPPLAFVGHLFRESLFVCFVSCFWQSHEGSGAWRAFLRGLALDETLADGFLGFAVFLEPGAGLCQPFFENGGARVKWSVVKCGGGRR